MTAERDYKPPSRPFHNLTDYHDLEGREVPVMASPPSAQAETLREAAGYVLSFEDDPRLDAATVGFIGERLLDLADLRDPSGNAPYEQVDFQSSGLGNEEKDVSQMGGPAHDPEPATETVTTEPDSATEDTEGETASDSTE